MRSLMGSGQHLLNHPPPSVESVIAVDAGGVFIVSRAGMRDERAFSNDEADAALGSPPVIAGDILTRHASGRHGASHSAFAAHAAMALIVIVPLALTSVALEIFLAGDENLSALEAAMAISGSAKPGPTK
jgi:hypothetical protein